MLVVRNIGYKKKYGSGLFDSVATLFKGLISSNVANQLLDVGKTVGKEAAIVAGKKLSEKAMDKILAPKKTLTPESQLIIDKYASADPPQPANINSVIDGAGRAVAIQDLVKRLTGSGIKRI